MADEIDAEIDCLRARIQQLERQKRKSVAEQTKKDSTNTTTFESDLSAKSHIERYSRQLLCGAWDTAGQERLSTATVLVVGAGGIGSAVLPYLCGAGVGTLRIADYDVVDSSNLHRQVLHDTPGRRKTDSARGRLQKLNPLVRIETMDDEPLTAETVEDALLNVDCVVDASDNPATRYMLNTACHRRKIPLISASAVQTTAQLTVYHHNPPSVGTEATSQTAGQPIRRPCYQCLYPPRSQQQTAGASASCNDVGVLGPVPGVVGTLQAMETLKVLTGYGQPLVDHLLLYEASDATWLRLRKPKKLSATCGLCNGVDSGVEEETLQLRGPSCAAVAPSNHNDDGVPSISVTEFEGQFYQRPGTVLLDVRVPAQFALCRLPGAVSLPLEDWTELPSPVSIKTTEEDGTKPPTYFCICRRGVASHAATERLLALGLSNIKNIRGGLDAWRRQVNPEFPEY